MGSKLWDKRFGGFDGDYLNAVLPTKDNGFILAGESLSGVGGDKTQPCYGGADYWIVKVDSMGNKEWDKDYGGGSIDFITMTLDNGYLLSGKTGANISAFKSENNLGLCQTWMVKTDSTGNKQLDKTALTNGTDAHGNWAIQTNDGCYVMASLTNANIGGDKTQLSWGIDGDSTDDYWMVKFCVYPTAVDEIATELQFNVYPNPFTNELDITIAQQNLHQATFTITNLLGQTIYTQNETNLSTSYTKMLDLSYLANGVYWVSVVVDGERITKEVIKSGP